jgi:putative flippase GtrA
MARILNRRWRMLADRDARITPRALISRIPVRRWRTNAKAALLSRVPERFHAITDELAKFGTIGVINLIVNFAVFNLLWLTVARSGEVKAKAVATIVATTCAYFLNRHWTYRDRPKSTLRREYSLFIFFNVVGFFIEVAAVAIAKYGFDQTHIVVLNIATAIGVAIGTVFRFWAYRTHVFKTEPAIDTATELAVEADEYDAHEHAAPVKLSVAGLQLRTMVPSPEALDHDVEPTIQPVTATNGHQTNGHNGHAADAEDQDLQSELVQLELAEIVEQAEQPIRR